LRQQRQPPDFGLSRQFRFEPEHVTWDRIHNTSFSS
jgi:hypothetical protein